MEAIDWFVLFIVLLAALPMAKLLVFGRQANE